MRTLGQLFKNNREWADGIRRQDPDFFRNLSQQQSPGYLWIGCADSRVPANQIVGLLPGELFVHRNLANLVVHTDLNCLSVMQFAVDVLKVRHVIVCGHYGCGGVMAALRSDRLGLSDNWFRHIQDVCHKHEGLLSGVGDLAATCHRLCELNVIEQVLNACQTTIARDAWQRGQELTIHGWIYSLDDGLVAGPEDDGDRLAGNGRGLQSRCGATVNGNLSPLSMLADRLGLPGLHDLDLGGPHCHLGLPGHENANVAGPRRFGRNVQPRPEAALADRHLRTGYAAVVGALVDRIAGGKLRGACRVNGA